MPAKAYGRDALLTPTLEGCFSLPVFAPPGLKWYSLRYKPLDLPELGHFCSKEKYTRHSCFEIFSPCSLFFLAEINHTSDLKVLCQCHVHHCWWTVRGNMGCLNWESPLGRSGASNQGAGEEELIILPCEDQHLSALCDRSEARDS